MEESASSSDAASAAPSAAARMEESASSSDAASAAPDAAPDAPMEDAAPGAPAAAEPEPEWKTSGPFVGQWITRSVLNEASKVASFSVGKVVGYLSAAESDYVDDAGAAAALWHVAYVSGELVDDSEDLEEWELLESAPRPTRPDGTIAQVTDEGLKKGVADAPAPAAAAEESEYEKHRRERIEANQAFLQSLGFTGGDVGLPKEEKKKRGPRKKAEPSAPTRRSARSTHEAGQYNENRAYKEAMAEKAADDAAEKARRLQRRLDKRQKKKRSVDELEKQRKRVDLLARTAAAAEKELLKHAAADAKAARALPRPCWLDARGPVDPSTAEGIDRDWCRAVASRNRWCPQVGDVVVYFADGHAEALEARRGRADFGDVEELWFEKRRPSWFLEPGAPRALECVVAAVLPCFPDEWVARKRTKLLEAVEKVAKRKEAKWFKKPVDHVALGLTDYPKVVKKPMDLGTVSDLVLQGAYDNDGCGGDRSFDDDLRLPFSNAILYNEADSDVAVCAAALLKVLDGDASSDDIADEPKKAEPARASSRLAALQDGGGGDDAAPAAEDRKDLKVEVVLRLVPLYMAADARAAGPDFAGGGEACRAALGAIDWHVWHSGFVVDPFNVSLSGHEDEDAFVMPRDVVFRSLLDFQACPLGETVVEVLDDDGDGRKMVLRDVRRADAHSKPYLPEWKAARLLPLGAPDAAPDAAPKKKKRKRLLGRPRPRPTTTAGRAAVREDPRLERHNLWDLVVVDEAVEAEAEAPPPPPPPPRRASRRGKKQDEEEPPAPPPAAAGPARPAPLPLLILGADAAEPDVLGEDEADAMAEALSAIKTTESGAMFWLPHGVDADDDSSDDDDGPRRGKRRRPGDEPPPAGDAAYFGRVASRACLRDVRRCLERGLYRRRDAAFDDVVRVYVEAAMASTSGACPRASAAKLCVQLSLEIMSDAGDAAARSATWAPKTAEVARRQAAAKHSPWQSFVRATAHVKTNTGVPIRENVKLAIGAALSHAKSPALGACVAAELHLALALYVGNAAGPCKETAARVLDVHGTWHLGADVAHKSDAVKFTTVGGRIEAVVEDTSDDAARRASVGKRFKRFLGDGFAIGTVLAYDPNTKKFAASYGDGRADEQLSVADVHGGLIAQLPPLPPKKGKPPTQPIAVTLKVAGTKLWCLKDAKDLAKVLNAFNG